MHQRKLFATTLAVLMAGAMSTAIAQDAPPPPPPAQPMQDTSQHGPMMRQGDHHDGGMMHHDGFGGERGGAIGDLRELEKLYMRAGRSRDLPALYDDVLAKTQDPRVRDYVYRQLARAQSQPANVDAAIATMRKALDESLANEAKMHAEMEKMRVRMEGMHTN